MSDAIKYETIKTVESFKEHIASNSLRNRVMRGLDLSEFNIDWNTIDTFNCAFLGCTFASIAEELALRKKGVRVSIPFTDVPYNPYRINLYTPNELMAGYNPDPLDNNSVDERISKHFAAHGGHDADIIEALAQRIHDYSIDEAVKELLNFDATGLPALKAVGVMGGHLTRRDDPYYKKTAHLARLMTRNGFYIISGGSPGIMEASNLGAYLADDDDQALDKAIDTLSVVPSFLQEDDQTIDPRYVEQAQRVLEVYPSGKESLAVPTWFYGAEPVNLFAKDIAKYFSNSLREDGLLAMSVYGVIFAPGSAATTEEVFMDAAQNHYGSFGYYSPMAFLGESHYLQSQIYACLTQQAAGRPYAQLITISDQPLELLKYIQQHPPIPR